MPEVGFQHSGKHSKGCGLPAPFSPKKAKISPFGTVIEMSLTAFTEPKVLVKFLISIISQISLNYYFYDKLTTMRIGM